MTREAAQRVRDSPIQTARRHKTETAPQRKAETARQRRAGAVPPRQAHVPDAPPAGYAMAHTEHVVGTAVSF